MAIWSGLCECWLNVRHFVEKENRIVLTNGILEKPSDLTHLEQLVAAWVTQPFYYSSIWDWNGSVDTRTHTHARTHTPIQMWTWFCVLRCVRNCSLMMCGERGTTMVFDPRLFHCTWWFGTKRTNPFQLNQLRCLECWNRCDQWVVTPICVGWPQTDALHFKGSRACHVTQCLMMANGTWYMWRL